MSAAPGGLLDETGTSDGPARSRRLPLLVLPAAAFLTVTAEALPVGLLRQMAEGLGTSPSRIGLLVAWFAVVAGTTPVLLTRVTRRLDRRAVAVAMLVLFAAACAVSAAAPSFAVVLVARAVLAMSHALLFTVGMVVLVRLAPPGRRGTAAGAMMVGASSAFVLGVPAATWFGQLLGWRAAHLLLGALALVLAVLLRAALPPVPPEPAGDGEGDVGVAALLTCRPLLAVLAVTGVLVLSHFSLFTFLAAFLEDEVGVPSRSLGLVLAAFGAAGVVGSLVGGRLAEARPHGVARTAVVVLLASLLVLRLAASSPAVVVLAVAVWGGTFSVIAVSQQLAVLRLVGHGPTGETAAALNGAVFQGGIATGSAVGSALVGAGLLAALPLVSAAVAALALAVVLSAGVAYTARPVPSAPAHRATGART
jgi:predicted MFS family arabinose efflux permease